MRETRHETRFDPRYDPKNAAKVEAVRQLLGAGKLEAARQSAIRLAQGAPRDVTVMQVAGECAILCGLQDQAWFYITRARELDPENADVLVNWARVARLMGKPEESLRALERAAELSPHWPTAHTELAGGLLDLGRPIDALEMTRAAVERMPQDPNLRSVLAACDLARGDAEGAIRASNEALDAAPEFAPLLGGRALIGNYAASLTRGQLFEFHVAYGRVVERDVAAREWPTRVLKEEKLHGVHVVQPGTGPAAPLRVGFVSPDFRRHSVAYFAEPLLKHRDASQVRTIVFQTNRIADDMTSQLRGMADEWHVCDTVTDAELAGVIERARIDVLFELSGHTHAHSLMAMAAKPAPVIVTYLGYPNTTGLTRIDARIVDRWTDPDGDEFATERLVRLDRCFLAFTPPGDSPEIVARDGSRPITFGSFNAIQKLSDHTVGLWARAVNAVEGSRLMLKANALSDARLREDVRARFARAGVASERLDVLGPIEETRGHLGAYAMVDIGLDPFPYHGTTTTCEAMWMGVPVVSRVGDRHAARVGASLLHAVGLDDLACASDDAFVEACRSLAEDGARLVRLRGRGNDGGEGSLRARMRASALCDGAGLWGAIERAVLGLYGDRCAGARR